MQTDARRWAPATLPHSPSGTRRPPLPNRRLNSRSIVSFFLFLLLTGCLSTCSATRRGAGRGQLLPFDPAEARARAEAELEEDLRREFVRTSMVDKDEMVYKYPSKSYGPIQKKSQCYSCMSLSYQNNWERLQHLYVQPKVFTDRCENPGNEEKMPTVECGSVCVSLVEADVEGGVFLGFKYIRGCINRILTHDFNLSALRTHRFTQAVDLCRSLPRTVLFNNPRTAPQVFGEVNLCTCFGDRCNSASQSGQRRRHVDSLGLIGGLLFSLLFLAHHL